MAGEQTTIDSTGALLGNLGSVDFVHKFEFNLQNVAFATLIVGGGVFATWGLMQLVKQKQK